MGRKRKSDPFGLAGTRLYIRPNGTIRYAHRDGEWETLKTTDIVEAKRIAAAYDAVDKDPQRYSDVGTMAFWFREFLADFKLRVAAGQRSQRTLDDYTADMDPTGPLSATFGKDRPIDIKPSKVQGYIDANALLDRMTRSNRERAALSTCLSWLIRNGRVPGLLVNVCMRASGIRRNAEKPRDRYVTDAEYRAVYAAGNAKVKLAMELVYRTLQRPEVDLLAWTTANIRVRDGQRVLAFTQSKTKTKIEIALTGSLDELVKGSTGDTVVNLAQPILHTLKGKAYTYTGLMSMVKKAQEKVREDHKKSGGPLANMPSFGLRDLKGKGATDMWRDGTPIERIQLLCGHKQKSTTEAYIKARWTEVVAPNNREIGGG